MVLSIGTNIPTTHRETATLPPLRSANHVITPCRHPRCITCRLHLNCAKTFKSNYPRNLTIYRIRHSFSCKSTNIVYLTKCTKCKKQYVGCTTTQLNTRINYHRTCINNKKTTYIHKHFNLPDHTMTNLTVQPIDTPIEPNTSQQDLYDLERFWIHTLHTLTPYGLNTSPGN